MDKLIARFPDQIDDFLQDVSKLQFKLNSGKIRNIYIAGMGGSGIGGEIVAGLVKDQCPVPVLIGRDYHLPGFIDNNTLVIASSYSGNTEETLSAFLEAVRKGAQIICITSGGKLRELAKENNIEYIELPSGWPAPRACLGYSLTAQLHIFQFFGFIDASFVALLKSTPAFLKSHLADIQSLAKESSKLLKGKIPVLYSTESLAPVALRFRQQLNENSKTLCWHNTFPEMNHNEIIGWSRDYSNLQVIYLMDSNEFDRTLLRMKITESVIRESGNQAQLLVAKGNNQIHRIAYLIHLTDWISWYLCQEEGHDAMQIKWIDHLKSELSKSAF